MIIDRRASKLRKNSENNSRNKKGLRKCGSVFPQAPSSLLSVLLSRFSAFIFQQINIPAELFFCRLIFQQINIPASTYNGASLRDAPGHWPAPPQRRGTRPYEAAD